MANTIGIPMCQAMMEYDQGNYNRAVELLYPLRYSIVKIGGSDAQARGEEPSASERKASQSINIELFPEVQPRTYSLSPKRDIFNQLLIHAAVKSENKHHKKLGRCLLVERDAMRPGSPLTTRLMQRALALH